MEEPEHGATFVPRCPCGSPALAVAASAQGWSLRHLCALRFNPFRFPVGYSGAAPGTLGQKEFLVKGIHHQDAKAQSKTMNAGQEEVGPGPGLARNPERKPGA